MIGCRLKMTDINFLYWLRGFLENNKDRILSSDDIKLIEQHLSLITCKEIKATVFIEGMLHGLHMAVESAPHPNFSTQLNLIISGVIQEVAEDKKCEKVTARRAMLSRGNGLSGGFHGGTTYC